MQDKRNYSQNNDKHLTFHMGIAQSLQLLSSDLIKYEDTFFSFFWQPQPKSWKPEA